MVEPNEIKVATGIGQGDNLKVFMRFGVDVLEPNDFASNSGARVGLELGDFLDTGKIDVAMGKVVK